MNQLQTRGNIKIYQSFYYTQRIHIFNASAILLTDITETYMSFFFSFLSSLVFLQLEREWEREYIIGYREKQSLKFTYLYDRLTFGEYFLFGLTEFIYAYRSGLKVWFLLVQDTFRPPPGDFCGSFNISYHFNYCSTNPGFDASPRSLALDPFTTASVPKLIFLIFYFHWRKKGAISALGS